MNWNFTINTAGWICIALEAALLLVWVYHIFGPRSGMDPAGKGMAQLFLLGLVAYIAAGIVLMLVDDIRCTIAVLLMGAIPLTLIVIGLVKYRSSSRNY